MPFLERTSSKNTIENDESEDDGTNANEIPIIALRAGSNMLKGLERYFEVAGMTSDAKWASELAETTLQKAIQQMKQKKIDDFFKITTFFSTKMISKATF